MSICHMRLGWPKVAAKRGAAVVTTISSHYSFVCGSVVVAAVGNRSTTKIFTNIPLRLRLRLSVGAIPAAAIGSTSSSNAQICWYLAHSSWYLI